VNSFNASPDRSIILNTAFFEKVLTFRLLAFSAYAKMHVIIYAKSAQM